LERYTDRKCHKVLRVSAAVLVLGRLLLPVADVLLGNFGAFAWGL